MTDIAIDFGEVQADEYTVVSPGKYSCTVGQVTVDQNMEKEDSHPYLKFELVIDETDSNYGGRKLFAFGSLSPKALGRTKALLESFGVDVTGNVKMKIDESTKLLITPDLAGEACEARVKAEMFEGEPRSKVSRLTGMKKPAEAGASAPAPAYK